MRSWSESFTHRADERRRKAKRRCGFIMTDEGELQLNTYEGFRAMLKTMNR